MSTPYEDVHGIRDTIGGQPKILYMYITVGVVAIVMIIAVIILSIFVAIKEPVLAKSPTVIPYSFVGLPIDAYVPNLSPAEAYGGGQYYSDSNTFSAKIVIYNLEGIIEKAHLQVGNEESYSRKLRPLDFVLQSDGNWGCEFVWTDHDKYYPLTNEAKYNIEKNNLYLEVITDMHLDGEIKGKFQVINNV